MIFDVCAFPSVSIQRGSSTVDVLWLELFFPLEVFQNKREMEGGGRERERERARERECTKVALEVCSVLAG